MRRTVVLSVLILASVAVLTAGSMQVRDPSEPGEGAPPKYFLGGLTFSLLSVTGTSPGTSPCIVNGVESSCELVNVSGVDWNSLTLTINPGGQLTDCVAAFGFAACLPLAVGAGDPTVIKFFGGAGIPNNTGFGVTLTGWAPNTTLEGVAGAVPEPATGVLLVAGIAALLWRRRR